MAPAAPGLRPRGEMVDGAEAVRDAVTASVAEEQQMELREARPAVRAAVRPLSWLSRLIDIALLPPRTPDRPGDDMLEPAEGGPSPAPRLPEAVAGL
ncbi:MAG: hypothetical protein M3131_08805 [Actinomycetota bacterium]|nr:hypothetical protein [Actinomycetota bacterium]